MMTLLLPSRSRKELKVRRKGFNFRSALNGVIFPQNKFKKEEKNSPHLISQALSKIKPLYTPHLYTERCALFTCRESAIKNSENLIIQYCIQKNKILIMYFPDDPFLN